MTALLWAGFGVLAALLARAMIPELGVLRAWKPFLAGVAGALSLGWLGALAAQESPLSLTTFAPVSMAFAVVGSMALLVALESRSPPP